MPVYTNSIGANATYQKHGQPELRTWSQLGYQTYGASTKLQN